jgi:lipoyl(octanoyl) transferase
MMNDAGKPGKPRIERLGRVSFDAALALQKAALAEIAEGRGPERLFLLEHEPVYTLGKTGDAGTLLDIKRLPHPVRTINRGGQATYHGPGQVMLYVLLDLRRRGTDLHGHLRRLEEVILRTAAAFGVRAGRREGLTGVWVADRKMASLGVGVRRWVTMHGLALNVTRESLEPFRWISPCGIAGVRMTCLEDELPAGRREVGVDEVGEELSRQGLAEFSPVGR